MSVIHGVQGEIDAKMMAAALAMARTMWGKTAPNPTVGCVLAVGDRIIAKGVTQPGGRPHAEAVALEIAGGLARGATAYVTLEPCAHLSVRGPACADSLIAAGISRAVVALTDPDPRTAGQGMSRLRDAGVSVELGVGADQAREVAGGFIKKLKTGLPAFLLDQSDEGFDLVFNAQPDETPLETLRRLGGQGALRVRLDPRSDLASNPQVLALLDR